MSPQPATDGVGHALIARMGLDKRYYGELDAVSTGEMLASVSASEKGSAGYVAMERVDGTLSGKRGSFVLQHSSTMTRGVPQQSITVVPDTGTGELLGLSGRMSIRVEDKKHYYDFAFTLPASHQAI